MKQNITVSRKTTESEIRVALDFSGCSADYRKKIKTPLPFLSHMIEHIAYRGDVTVETTIDLAEFTLTHVVAEDLGQTMGRAFLEYLQYGKEFGMNGYGVGIGIIDEAQAQAAISFESRAYFDFVCNGVTVPELVEGMESADLTTFLEGFAQGAQCTLQIDVKRGSNPHHIFEAVFRAVGICLKEAFAIRDERKGKTAGVAGSIHYDVTPE